MAETPVAGADTQFPSTAPARHLHYAANTRLQQTTWDRCLVVENVSSPARATAVQLLEKPFSHPNSPRDFFYVQILSRRRPGCKSTHEELNPALPCSRVVLGMAERLFPLSDSPGQYGNSIGWNTMSGWCLHRGTAVVRETSTVKVGDELGIWVEFIRASTPPVGEQQQPYPTAVTPHRFTRRIWFALNGSLIAFHDLEPREDLLPTVTLLEPGDRVCLFPHLFASPFRPPAPSSLPPVPSPRSFAGLVDSKGGGAGQPAAAPGFPQDGGLFMTPAYVTATQGTLKNTIQGNISKRGTVRVTEALSRDLNYYEVVVLNVQKIGPPGLTVGIATADQLLTEPLETGLDAARGVLLNRHRDGHCSVTEVEEEISISTGDCIGCGIIWASPELLSGQQTTLTRITAMMGFGGAKKSPSREQRSRGSSIQEEPPDIAPTSPSSPSAASQQNRPPLPKTKTTAAAAAAPADAPRMVSLPFLFDRSGGAGRKESGAGKEKSPQSLDGGTPHGERNQVDELESLLKRQQTKDTRVKLFSLVTVGNAGRFTARAANAAHLAKMEAIFASSLDESLQSIGAAVHEQLSFYLDQLKSQANLSTKDTTQLQTILRQFSSFDHTIHEGEEDTEEANAWAQLEPGGESPAAAEGTAVLALPTVTSEEPPPPEAPDDLLWADMAKDTTSVQEQQEPTQQQQQPPPQPPQPQQQEPPRSPAPGASEEPHSIVLHETAADRQRRASQESLLSVAPSLRESSPSGGRLRSMASRAGGGRRQVASPGMGLGGVGCVFVTLNGRLVGSCQPEWLKRDTKVYPAFTLDGGVSVRYWAPKEARGIMDFSESSETRPPSLYSQSLSLSYLKDIVVKQFGPFACHRCVFNGWSIVSGDVPVPTKGRAAAAIVFRRPLSPGNPFFEVTLTDTTDVLIGLGGDHRNFRNDQPPRIGDEMHSLAIHPRLGVMQTNRENSPLPLQWTAQIGDRVRLSASFGAHGEFDHAVVVGVNEDVVGEYPVLMSTASLHPTVIFNAPNQTVNVRFAGPFAEDDHGGEGSSDLAQHVLRCIRAQTSLNHHPPTASPRPTPIPLAASQIKTVTLPSAANGGGHEDTRRPLSVSGDLHSQTHSRRSSIMSARSQRSNEQREKDRETCRERERGLVKEDLEPPGRTRETALAAAMRNSALALADIRAASRAPDLLPSGGPLPVIRAALPASLRHVDPAYSPATMAQLCSLLQRMAVLSLDDRGARLKRFGPISGEWLAPNRENFIEVLNAAEMLDIAHQRFRTSTHGQVELTAQGEVIESLSKGISRAPSILPVVAVHGADLSFQIQPPKSRFETIFDEMRMGEQQTGEAAKGRKSLEKGALSPLQRLLSPDQSRFPAEAPKAPQNETSPPPEDTPSPEGSPEPTPDHQPPSATQPRRPAHGRELVKRLKQKVQVARVLARFHRGMTKTGDISKTHTSASVPSSRRSSTAEKEDDRLEVFRRSQARRVSLLGKAPAMAVHDMSAATKGTSVVDLDSGTVLTYMNNMHNLVREAAPVNEFALRPKRGSQIFLDFTTENQEYSPAPSTPRSRHTKRQASQTPKRIPFRRLDSTGPTPASRRSSTTHLRTSIASITARTPTHTTPAANNDLEGIHARRASIVHIANRRASISMSGRASPAQLSQRSHVSRESSRSQLDTPTASPRRTGGAMRAQSKRHAVADRHALVQKVRIKKLAQKQAGLADDEMIIEEHPASTEGEVAGEFLRVGGHADRRRGEKAGTATLSEQRRNKLLTYLSGRPQNVQGINRRRTLRRLSITANDNMSVQDAAKAAAEFYSAKMGTQGPTR
ncbi:unnamed protein product [Vitrella brassicaformis CCMP3155]|uniref:Uncharacterized protein n=1 Tax=Vitrella brassicaformis (strain CCMP3155) TaxID=1169540 RepID=A0A0G4GRW8_VITBC|nr:unnamed protein product [Vitrella brassicaformis CCMP3155]|eukprot:CEM33359.1 unnamed protein product [Vitrella brassicaformis CCMP3155]